MSYLNDCKIVNINQFGFFMGLVSDLTTLISDISKMVDGGRAVAAAFFDLSKAFNCVIYH